VQYKYSHNSKYFFTIKIQIQPVVSLHALYSSPNILRVIKSRRMRWEGHLARIGVERGVYRVLVRKHEGKRQLGRPRVRWEEYTRMDLQEVGCGGTCGLGWLRIETYGGQL
jgi:hypothetical protein